MKSTAFFLLFSLCSLLHAFPGANTNSSFSKEIAYASFEITSADVWEDNISQIADLISLEAKALLFQSSIEAINDYSLYNSKHAKELLRVTIKVGTLLSSKDEKVKDAIKNSLAKANQYYQNLDPEDREKKSRTQLPDETQRTFTP